MLVNSFVKASWKTFGKVPYGERVVDIEMGMADEFFKLRNITIRILRIHLESLHDDGPSLFFLQNIGILLTEGCDGAVILPGISGVHSFLIYLSLEPLAH